VFLIVLPFLGALVYLIAQHDGMAQRSAEAAQSQKAQFDDYVRSVNASGGAASEIDKAKRCSTAARSPRTSSPRSRPRRWRCSP
jgi:hypothetical protein